jgi:hypothetical protein
MIYIEAFRNLDAHHHEYDSVSGKIALRTIVKKPYAYAERLAVRTVPFASNFAAGES